MSSQKVPVIGLIVPCKNEEPVLPETARTMKSKIDSLVARGMVNSASRIYFIDDGSTDGTWEIICQLAESDSCFQGVKLTRNFGHQFAVYAGLMHAEGDALISIDADLQDDINAIDEMVGCFLKGDEVVYGVRGDRHSDKKLKRWTAALHYWLSGRLGVRTVPHHADFRLLSRQAVTLLGQFRETNLYLRGVVPLLGLPSSQVHYARGPRMAGESKYGFADMFGLSVDGLTSFSILPLRVISLLGLFVFLVSMVFGVWALVAYIVGLTTPLDGWAPTGIPIYLLGGLQILSIGVVGEYIGKTYMEVKSRPTYLIEKTVSKASD
ncbi:glycosyltransferase family 2 protein [Candidatus Marimicrobium litorale]|uniref:Glycosyltransferase n=1 Tax=Candidatus Marimicrobium litorale TaxID=2518991 RepID=A0ABT3T3G4_9GAMM|nr:glycosyltransferase family 2 protein [Candidatus Marimicrobium litorale]MCX2976812.1 glycosyltransferase [Candidatus Marimicrobium litorale]